MYFQFHTVTGDFIQAFENAKKFTCIVGDDTVTRGKDFFKHTPEVMLKSGIRVGALIKDALTYGTKHSAPVDDPVALTRTYSSIYISGLAVKEAQQKENHKTEIDKAAATVRRYFVPDQLLEEEYRRTETLVRKWVAGGSGIITIPQCLQTEIDRGVLTPAEVATNILARADALNGVLDTVRELRLKGKDLVDAAKGEAIKTTYNGVVAQLNSLLPEVL
jgi:hypothetical protein